MPKPATTPSAKPGPQSPPPAARYAAPHANTPGLTEATPSVGGVKGPELPLGVPEPAFLLVAHPARLTVIAGMVVPLCSRLSTTAGQKQVDADAKGRPLMESAIANQVERGGIVLRWDVDGPGRSYLRKVDGTSGWVTRFETVFAGSDVRRVDQAAYAKWLRELMERGVIPMPTRHHLEALAEDLDKRIAVLTDKPGHKPKLLRAQEDRAAVTAELEKIEAAAVLATSEETPDVAV